MRLAISVALSLLAAAACCAQPPLITADFDDGKLDEQVFPRIPSRNTPVGFEPRSEGKALHLRAEGHNVGIAARRPLPGIFKLQFDFCQPASEASGYRTVVAHSAAHGQSFWFEYDKTDLAVWTDYDGTWAPRWEAAGLLPDTWYSVTVDNELERVRFRLELSDGRAVAESPWLPHDVVGVGSLSFRADTADTVRGALFDNIRIQLPPAGERAGLVPGVEKALHESMAACRPAPRTDAMALGTEDGLQLRLDASGIVRAWRIAGRTLPAPNALSCGGLWARDVAAGRDYHRLAALPGSTGRELKLACDALGLRFEAQVRPIGARVELHGTLSDTTGTDRALVLVWALPLDATGWQWGDDPLRAREVGAEGRYHNCAQYPSPGRYGTHLVSTYPWASVAGPDAGLVLSRPLDEPRLMAFHLDHMPQARFLAVRVELGLSPVTSKFPSSADFRFCLNHLPRPEWGFRSATQSYYDTYPEFFRKRAQREGIWHLWVSPEVPQPEDFGLVFHEQEPFSEDRVVFDDTHNAYSLTYAEPNALWQHTKEWDGEGRLDMGSFMARVRERARQSMDVLTDYPFVQPRGLPDAEIARALLNSYIGNEGSPAVYAAPPDRVTVNCNGDPELPAPNRATLWFDYEGLPALTDDRVDGAYMDSLGWGGFDNGEDFRREHWATADIPLIPSFREGKPCQLAAFTHYELYQAVADVMHRRGKLTIANTFPFAHGFVAHLLDIMGAGESNDLNHFHDPTRLSYCRALAYHKPVSHMNYGYLLPEVPLEEKERAMQRNLVFGVWPGTGNGGNLAHLEAVRPLYRKYIPIFARLAQAGWEPVTLAHAQPAGVIVERYGGPEGPLYLALHNPADETVVAQVKADSELGVRDGETVDLVSGGRYRVGAGTLAVELKGYQTVVLVLTPERHESQTTTGQTG